MSWEQRCFANKSSRLSIMCKGAKTQRTKMFHFDQKPTPHLGVLQWLPCHNFRIFRQLRAPSPCLKPARTKQPWPGLPMVGSMGRWIYYPWFDDGGRGDEFDLIWLGNIQIGNSTTEELKPAREMLRRIQHRSQTTHDTDLKILQYFYAISQKYNFFKYLLSQ